MPNIRKFERGQVLVLLVAGVVGLLAFAALAIDGGMLYSQRRFDQNLADASALAGGAAATNFLVTNDIDYPGYSCTYTAGGKTVSQVAREKAKATAQQAGVTLVDVTSIPNPPTEENWLYIKCNSDLTTNLGERFVEVHVQIASQVKTNFAHLIYGGDLKTRVESIVNARPEAGAGLGNTLVALHPTCDNGTNTGGINLMGDGYMHISEGGLFSYACIYKGGNYVVEVDTPPNSNHCMVPADDSCYVSSGGSGSIDPPPDYSPQKLEVKMPVPTYCSGTSLGDFKINNGDIMSLNPGIYDSVEVLNGGTLELKSGLYCFEGNGNGSNIPGLNLGGGTITGYGVTLYFKQGTFASNAGTFVEMYAPVKDTADCPVSHPDGSCEVATAGAVPGLLMYMADGNTNEIKIAGTQDSVFQGTIYGKDAKVDIGGNSNVADPTQTWAVKVQVIADTIKIHGNVTFDATYDKNSTFTNPGWLQLQK